MNCSMPLLIRDDSISVDKSSIGYEVSGLLQAGSAERMLGHRSAGKSTGKQSSWEVALLHLYTRIDPGTGLSA